MDRACLYSLIFGFSILILFTRATHATVCHFDSLYQFGDSISDTGNIIRIGTIGPTLPAASPPYGETFPGRPTGRWSDGLLIIDFTAVALGLPLLNPYLQKNASFVNGVNFAVAGSTALDFPFFIARGIQVPPLTVPLSGQLNWFRAYLSTICSNATECANRLRRALVFMGEIGGDDINFPLTQGKTVQEIQTYIPFITQAIINATREVIQLGATRIVVPGNFPIGCIPFTLTYASRNSSTTYDDLGCVSSYNDLAKFQNQYLQDALDSLRKEFPNVVILYADYYNSFQSVLRDAPILGFNPSSLLKACCGTGGQYNYDPNNACGSPGVPLCPNPSRYISWDGVHLTQEAYRRISQIVISDILLRINCF